MWGEEHPPWRGSTGKSEVEVDPKDHQALLALAAAEISASTKHLYGFNPLHSTSLFILQEFLPPEICFQAATSPSALR